MVSIAAFQAVDPGSIPGQRNKPFLDDKSLSAISFMIFTLLNVFMKSIIDCDLKCILYGGIAQW